MLKALMRAIMPSPDMRQVNLKEIFCFDKGGTPIQRFRTRAEGAELTNPDGSSRQAALAKVKVGEKVRLIWDADNPDQKALIYLVRGGMSDKLSMADCFGRLNSKVAADVIGWLTRENVVTLARVMKIVGGKPKNPRLGCILELSTHPGPGKKP